MNNIDIIIIGMMVILFLGLLMCFYGIHEIKETDRRLGLAGDDYTE